MKGVWAGGCSLIPPTPKMGRCSTSPVTSNCHILSFPTRLSLYSYTTSASLYIDSKKERDRLKERERLLCRLIACQRHLVCPRRSALVLLPPPILAPAVWAGLKYYVNPKVGTTAYDRTAPQPPPMGSFKYTCLPNLSLPVSTDPVRNLFLWRNTILFMRNCILTLLR